MPAATVKVSRKWGGWVYRSRPYEISIDGTQVGSVVVDETKELSVEPGHHVLQMGSGRHLSAKRSFDVGQGEEATFWCRGTMLWPIYIAALIKPDLWITLRQG